MTGKWSGHTLLHYSSGLFKNVVLNGSVEDNGTAIGAALAASNLLIKEY